MRLRRLSHAALTVTLAACSAEPERVAPTRWPTRCNSDVVPFIPPLGLANTRQTVTFHFRANIVCNTGGHEAQATIELRTPSNEVVPIESMETGRVDSWRGEANVFTVSVVTRLPDVSVGWVRATIHVEGKPFVRDVFLMPPAEDVRTLTWSEAPLPFTMWWDVGPDERVATTESRQLVTWLHPLRTTRLAYSNSVAATTSLLAVGGRVLDRGSALQLKPQMPAWYHRAAAMGDELLAVSRLAADRNLVRVERDGGETLFDSFPGWEVLDMVVDGDQLLLALQNQNESRVEIRSRANLSSQGTVIDVTGSELLGGTNRMWVVRGDKVTAISGDGGMQSITRPPIGSWVSVRAPGPTRPGFVVPGDVNWSEVLLWLPATLPDGGLTSMYVAIESDDVRLNDQWLFVDGRFARLPVP